MKIVKFLVAGGSAAVVEYGVFLLLQLTLGEGWLVISQTLSLLAGFVVSFSLNKIWVFRSDGRIWQELAKYLILLAINLLVTNIILDLLVNHAHIKYWIAKICVMAMVAMWNYFLFQKIVFKSKKMN